MPRTVLIILVVVVYALHQDFWLWRTAQPVVLGFLPAGLAYHVAYTVVAAAVMGILIRYAWPAGLEREAEDHQL